MEQPFLLELSRDQGSTWSEVLRDDNSFWMLRQARQRSEASADLYRVTNLETGNLMLVYERGMPLRRPEFRNE